MVFGGLSSYQRMVLLVLPLVHVAVLAHTLPWSRWGVWSALGLLSFVLRAADHARPIPLIMANLVLNLAPFCRWTLSDKTV